MQQRILFRSFLKELRSRDIKAWRLILLCLLLQLVFIIIKLEATPFFLFGMFSEKMRATDTIAVPGVRINDAPLSTFRPSVRESQLLETTALNYIEMKRNNNTDPVKTRIESRYPFIYNASMYPLIATNLYNNVSDMHAYRNWLKAKCLRIAGLDSGTVKIIETRYIRTTQGPVLIKSYYETLETF